MAEKVDWLKEVSQAKEEVAIKRTNNFDDPLIDLAAFLECAPLFMNSESHRELLGLSAARQTDSDKFLSLIAGKKITELGG